jgi:hypothetical protein
MNGYVGAKNWLRLKKCRMEKLVQQLIEKHKLEKSEAIEAIRMVAEYLKKENPAFQKLIDSVVEDRLKTNEKPGRK